MSPRLPRLGHAPDAPFPPVSQALHHPNGLLAFGGDLSPARLMNAYRHGIFPWYSEGEPILWWWPDPRTVFDTGTFHLPRRFRRSLRSMEWSIRADTAFQAVVDACADTPRPGQDGTWILPEMRTAYLELHRQGQAHSIEIFAGEELVGGIYGVLAGPVFCGESMFSHASGGSKLALAALCRLLADNGAAWLDAQMHTAHLASLGAQPMPRTHYLRCLQGPMPQRLATLPWNLLLNGLRPTDLA